MARIGGQICPVRMGTQWAQKGAAPSVSGRSYVLPQGCFLPGSLRVASHSFAGQQSLRRSVHVRPRQGVRCALDTPDTAIISGHTHALGRNVGADFGEGVPLQLGSPWPWQPPAAEPVEVLLKMGHAQIMCPDAVRPKVSPPRFRLPRGLSLVRAPSASPIPPLGVTQRELLLVLGAGGLVLLAVLNKILFKMAIASMPDQPFVLANVCTLGYLMLYSGIVCFRWKKGIVSSAMLRYPKKSFVAIGALEAAGAMLGLFAAGFVPGTILPVLSQGYLVWQLGLSALFLRRRYAPGQLLGVGLSLAGIATVVTSAHSGAHVAPGAGDPLLFPCLYLLSASFSAAASLVKERLFKDAPQHLGEGQTLDLFVVNLLGSSFQSVFLLLLLPLVASARGIPPPALPAHLAAGAGCFLGHATASHSCHGAPLLPLAYICTNLAFNVAQLALLKATTAVVPSIALTLAVPLSVAAFTFPLPLLGTPSPLPASFMSGTFILLSGLVCYLVNGKRQPEQQKKPRTVSLQPHFERAVAMSRREGLTPRVRVLSKKWSQGL